MKNNYWFHLNLQIWMNYWWWMLYSTGSEDLWEWEASSCRRSHRRASTAGLWEELQHVHLSSALAVCTNGPTSFRQVGGWVSVQISPCNIVQLIRKKRNPNYICKMKFMHSLDIYIGQSCRAGRRAKRLIKISDSWTLLKATKSFCSAFVNSSWAIRGQDVWGWDYSNSDLYRRFGNIFSWCEDVVEGHFQKKWDSVPVSSTTSVVKPLRQRL